MALGVLPLVGSIDVRVSKGQWNRGYHTVRVSAIGNSTDPVVPPLHYHAQFQKRWTEATLDTEIFHIPPEGRTLTVGGLPMRISLPAPGAAVRGLLFADPCWSSAGGMACPNGDRFQVKDHMTRLISQLVASDDFHFWGILGDNFYDVFGHITREFFDPISLQAKAKPFVSVPGNHDFWQCGRPVDAPGDQYGWGFLQFYGQDTAATQWPYDFAGSPTEVPQAPNFIFGHVIGDIGLFGFSGAHSWKETEPHARAFCLHVGTQPVNAVAVLGHWNINNLGAMPEMETPAVWRKMKAMQGCAGKKVLYFDGHEHCNRVQDYDGDETPANAAGFMVGGTGMYGNGCSELGFAVISSEPGAEGGPDVRVDHFVVARDPSFGNTPSAVEDRFEALRQCFDNHPFEHCRDAFATPFRSKPPPFECDLAPGWLDTWSAGKRQWCCANRRVGCPGCDTQCGASPDLTCRNVVRQATLGNRTREEGLAKCAAYLPVLAKECPGCADCSPSELCPGVAAAAPEVLAAAPPGPPAGPPVAAPAGPPAAAPVGRVAGPPDVAPLARVMGPPDAVPVGRGTGPPAAAPVGGVMVFGETQLRPTRAAVERLNDDAVLQRDVPHNRPGLLPSAGLKIIAVVGLAFIVASVTLIAVAKVRVCARAARESHEARSAAVGTPLDEYLFIRPATPSS